MEKISKITIAHIASEVIIIGGISFFFHKKIADLKTKISELETKIVELEKNNSNDSMPKEEFIKFQQYISQHINNLYEITKERDQNKIPPKPIKPLLKKRTHNSVPMAFSLSSISEHNNHNHNNHNHNNHNHNNSRNNLYNDDDRPKFEVIDEEEEEKYPNNKVQENQEDDKYNNEEDLDKEIEEELGDLNVNEENENENNLNESDLNKNNNNIESQITPLEFVSLPKKKKTTEKKLKPKK